MNSSIKLFRRDVLFLGWFFISGWFLSLWSGWIVGSGTSINTLSISSFTIFLLVASDLIALLSGLVPLLPWLLALWSGSTLWAWFTLWAWSGLLISRLIRISFFLFLAVVITAVSIPATVIFSAIFTFTTTVEAG